MSMSLHRLIFGKYILRQDILYFPLCMGMDVYAHPMHLTYDSTCHNSTQSTHSVSGAYISLYFGVKLRCRTCLLCSIRFMWWECPRCALVIKSWIDLSMITREAHNRLGPICVVRAEVCHLKLWHQGALLVLDCGSYMPHPMTHAHKFKVCTFGEGPHLSDCTT